MEVAQAVDVTSTDVMNPLKIGTLTANTKKDHMLKSCYLGQVINLEQEKPSALNSIEPTPFEAHHDKTKVAAGPKEIPAALIKTSSIEEVYPCTPLQEGLMTLSIMQHGKYVPRMIYKLHSSIDIERFH